MLEYNAIKSFKQLVNDVSHPLHVVNVIIIKKEGRLSLRKFGIFGETKEILIQYAEGVDLSKAVSDGVRITGSRLRVHLDESVDSMSDIEADEALEEIFSEMF